MRRYFFDASAVVKLHAVEPGSSAVHDLMRSANRSDRSTRVFVCDISLPEAVSALQQIQRGPHAARKGLSAAALRQAIPILVQSFTQESPLIVVQASEVMHAAAGIIQRWRLRPADAIQVAAAVRARDNLDEGAEISFVSADRVQCAAARHEGLNVLELAA
jgi:predicted nucleic acid-binding protein